MADRVPARSTPWPRVSVIIPTYREPDNVSACVEAVLRQDYPADKVQVVVVDNAPAPGDVLHLASERVTVLHEPRPGSYAARNTGVAASNGEVIAFTDSDCVPHPEWLHQSVLALEGGAHRVAGHIQLFTRHTRPNVAEDLQKSFAFDVVHDLETRNQVAAANFVVWREAFDRVGPFRPDMLSGGDVEWGRRAVARTLVTHYVASAIVYHPARFTLGQLLRHRKRIAGATRSHSGVAEKAAWATHSLVRRRGVLQRIFGRTDISLWRKTQVFVLAAFLHLYQTWESVLLIAFPGRGAERR